MPFLAPSKRKIAETLTFKADQFSGGRPSSLNNPNYLHEKRTIVNAQVGIEGAKGRWRLTFWGKNIFDNDASELSFDFLGTDYTMLVAPRTLGVELGFSF